MDFSFLRDVNTWSVLLRILMAVICGGLIGVERETHRKQAGFRTHILICLGAAITTLTSQYLLLVLHQYTDIARLGAQVIAGLGFIGAGTIIVTRRLRIKGLTTAAGLWVTGIIGLCCGAGYYEAAGTATVLLVFIEIIISSLEKKYIRTQKQESLLIEISDISALGNILQFFADLDIVILGMDVLKEGKNESGKPCVSVEFGLTKKLKIDEVIANLSEQPSVVKIENLSIN